MANTTQIKATVAFRVINKPGKFTFSINGNSILELNQSSMTGGYYDPYALLQTGINDFSNSTDNITVDAIFNNSSTSDNAWLDFIEIICDRNLQFSGNQMTFRNVNSQSASIIQYTIGNSSNIRVWDVTTPTNVKEISISNGNFKAYGGNINE